MCKMFAFPTEKPTKRQTKTYLEDQSSIDIYIYNYILYTYLKTPPSASTSTSDVWSGTVLLKSRRSAGTEAEDKSFMVLGEVIGRPLHGLDGFGYVPEK